MLRRTFLRNSIAIAAIGRAPGAFPPESRRILYVMGQFSQGSAAQMRAAVQALGGSSFNVLILSFLQLSISAGRLNVLYDGTPIDALDPAVPGLLRRLRSGFAARKQILLSIGGWAQTSAFEAIRSFGVPAFVARLTREVMLPLGVDGIDLDLEPATGGLDQWIAVHHEYGKTLVDLTNEFKRVNPNRILTHAPVSSVAARLYAKAEPLPGLPHGLLAATRVARRNNIDWLNVQFYEGGAVPGSTIAGYYRRNLAGPLVEIENQTSIYRPLHFLTPLFEPQAAQPLAFCRETIREIDRECRDLQAGRVDGAALWEYGQIAANVNEWSDGLSAALAG